jgi:hypothetical protein
VLLRANPEAPSEGGDWVEGFYNAAGLVPVHFGDAIHFNIKLSPHVKKMYRDVLVLVTRDVAVFPGYLAGGKLAVDFVKKVVMWLFQGM